MNQIKKISATIFMLSIVMSLSAQGDYYDNSGKIYTVVAVVCITLFAIVGLLVYLERRIKILEKLINDEQRSN